MNSKDKDLKFYTVESASFLWEGYNGKYETYEQAEERARSSAWRNGEDYVIMGIHAIARAPEEIVNTVKMEKVK